MSHPGSDWEMNTYAGLERLDDEGRARVSRLSGPPMPQEDEPPLAIGHLRELGELELASQPPRLA